MDFGQFEHLNLNYPKSRILAKVCIADCIKLDPDVNKKIIMENELVYGHKFNRTGYAWKLENIKKDNYKNEISGKQGIWNIEL